MRRRQPLTPPGRLPPLPGGRDPPPLDRRDNGAAARRRRSPATAMTSMPAIDIGALFIGRDDREGDDGSGIATEDDYNTDVTWGGTRAISRRSSSADFGKGVMGGGERQRRRRRRAGTTSTKKLS
jgi:hypothetical protein